MRVGGGFLGLVIGGRFGAVLQLLDIFLGMVRVEMTGLVRTLIK